MDLPSYLQPQDDGWCLEDAVSIWLLVHYGIHRADPDTAELRRLRFRARQEVATVASELPDHLKPPTIRRVARDWEGSAADSFPRQTRWVAPPRTWVTMTALAGLCHQHGYFPPWEEQAPLTTLQPQPPAAVVPVVTLEQTLGADEQQGATAGRPSTNAEAYAYIDSLLAKKMGKKAAYREAAIKFPQPGIDNETRTSRLESGYYQYDQKRKKSK